MMRWTGQRYLGLRPFAFLLGCWFLVAGSVASAAPVPDPGGAAAREALRSGDINRALELFREAVEQQPEDLGLRRDYLWLLWRSARYAECVRQAEKILEGQPGDREALELAARSHQRLGAWPLALEWYRRRLEADPDEPGLKLEVIRIHEAQRQYDEAWAAFERLRQEHPEFAAAVSTGARLAELRGDSPMALRLWAEAAEAEPSNRDFAFRRAQARYFAGQEDEAVAELEAILHEDPGHVATRELRFRVSLVGGDLQGAIRWLDGQSYGGNSADVPKLVRLAGLQLRANAVPVALATIERALALVPDHAEALWLRADLLRRAGRMAEAVAAYAEVTRLQPASVQAWLGLADGHVLLQQPAEACRAAQRARQLDPTNPRLVLREGQALYDAGRRDESRRLLRDWIERNPGGEVPVLLYHGLAESARDPMLVSRIHLTTGRFRQQLQGLAAAGWRTVRLADVRNWLEGRKQLPARSVVITFDDGRLDSLRQADPVLAELGFQAAMFVAGINADRNLPGYATWEELKEFARTGRWELQSHGDRASLDVSVDATGLTGKFLANRMWRSADNRRETEAEWATRIGADYQAMIPRLARVTGREPIAYAWPEGNFGQQGYVNVPAAAERNIALARQHFRLAFHQDGSGVNSVTRDPCLLGRLEPSPDWTAADLLAQLAESSPRVRIARQLLKQALWEADAGEAEHWLRFLAECGLAESTFLLERARVDLIRGRYAEAAGQLEEYLRAHPNLAGKDRVMVWVLLATALREMGEFDRAVEGLNQALVLDPSQLQVRLDLAVLYEARRDYARALEVALGLRREEPGFAKVLPVLARIEEARGNFEAAASWWALASEAFQDRVSYRFRRWAAGYRAGQAEVALRELEQLLVEHPEDRETRDFLVQCALVREEMSRALSLLEGRKQLAAPVPASLSLQIANLQVRQQNYAAAEAEIDEALDRSPDHAELWLLKADCARQAGRFEEAASIFARVGGQNPWCERAWLGLADVQLLLRQHPAALRSIRALRKLDPTNPNFLLREAEVAYAAGEVAVSQNRLAGWLATNAGPALPVLSYHGLASSPADPLLAQRIHLTVETFEDHVRQLKEQGYTAVSVVQVADWFAGRGVLPAQPVLITFDGGRQDSLRHADAVLVKYGFRAVMFLSAADTDRGHADYATWEELAAYQRTGRWEIQSQGNQATVSLPLDATGRTGPFLLNRKWLDADNRLETVAEWESRVQDDLAATVTVWRARLAGEPTAFAWPGGNLGQQGVPNVPGAAEANLALIRARYRIAFHADAYGVNLRTRDPALLSRLEPAQSCSGADLVRQLEDQNPLVKLGYQTLRQAAWQGRIREGFDWLERLRADGASPAKLLAAEALLRLMAGDVAGAQKCLARAEADGPRPDVESLQRSLERRLRPEAGLTFEWWRDDDDRQSLAATVRGEIPLGGLATLEAEAAIAQYSQPGFEDIEEYALSLSARRALGAFHQVEAGFGGHHFSGAAEDAISAHGLWSADWTDRMRTVCSVDSSPLYTVQALGDEVRYFRGHAELDWQLGEAWNWRLYGRYWDYTDGNTRLGAGSALTYAVPWVPRLEVLYRLTFEDASEYRSAYYTPQALIQNQLGFGYSWEPFRRAVWRLRYLPGYGYEDNGGGRFVHALHTDLSLRTLLDILVQPALDFQQTPTYHMFRATLTLQKRF